MSNLIRSACSAYLPPLNYSSLGSQATCRSAIREDTLIWKVFQGCHSNNIIVIEKIHFLFGVIIANRNWAKLQNLGSPLQLAAWMFQWCCGNRAWFLAFHHRLWQTYCFWWIIIPIHHWLWKITEKTTGVKAVRNYPFHICTHYILALPPLFQHSSNVMCLYLQGILIWIVLELWFEDNSEVYLAGIWEIRGRSTH